ncbi:hypothetical protein [Alkalibacterium gilvum]|uniref:hypothetical protein n=1 Tax=Alkalibacterium gilvum TaxID=1130080 RepID=UPI003F91311C
MKEVRMKHRFTDEPMTTEEYIRRRMANINSNDVSERKEKLKEIIGKEIDAMEI